MIGRSDDFVYGDDIDKILWEMGVDKKTLKNDLKYSLNLEHSVVEMSKYLFRFREKDVLVTAEREQEEGDICIVDFLDKCDLGELIQFWNVQETHDAITALMRHPGGLHEWLMVAAIPVYKAMGIPMEFVKISRTPTNECYFDFDGQKNGGVHGGNGTTTMHNDLRAAINEAYAQCAKVKIPPFMLLIESLKEFRSKYYRLTPVPKGLSALFK